MLREEVSAWLALLAFALCAAAFLIKCGSEVAQRRLDLPKTLHISLAAGLFITPALQNLEVAFHGLNTRFDHQVARVVSARVDDELDGDIADLRCDPYGGTRRSAGREPP